VVETLIRGGVYLTRLDPVKGAEVGKLRPVVLLTAQALLDVDPPILFVCPLSSRSDPAYQTLHVPISARDEWRVESFGLVEHCRAISRQRVLSHRLAQLTDSELDSIVGKLQRLIGA
jgi:mRNA interferase MazF